jgi:hypothetical protein
MSAGWITNIRLARTGEPGYRLSSAREVSFEGRQAQLGNDLLEIGCGQRRNVAYSNVMVRIERLEAFGRAMAARYIDDLVRGESAPLSQYLIACRKPDLGLAMIDLLCVKRSPCLHEASLPFARPFPSHLLPLFAMKSVPVNALAPERNLSHESDAGTSRLLLEDERPG